MNELLSLTAALAAGVLLGAFFFTGLWWTVRKGVSSPRPVLWFFGSMLLRMSITVAGFYIVGGENWQRWLACLFGFILARFVVKWMVRARVEQHNSRAPGTPYAS